MKVLLIFFLTADLFGNMGFYGKEKTSDYFQKTRILEKISSDQGHFRIFLNREDHFFGHSYFGRRSLSPSLFERKASSVDESALPLA